MNGHEANKLMQAYCEANNVSEVEMTNEHGTRTRSLSEMEVYDGVRDFCIGGAMNENVAFDNGTMTVTNRNRFTGRDSVITIKAIQ